MAMDTSTLIATAFAPSTTLTRRHSLIFPSALSPQHLRTPDTIPRPSLYPSRPLPMSPHLHPRCQERQQTPRSSKPPPSSTSPPTVKPIFYRNPSLAIEKGGGFYIPGLRGVRLRYFVSAVSFFLLLLNHFLSPTVDSPTLRTSEALAVFAVVAVFATAIYDTVSESKSAAVSAPTIRPTTKAPRQPPKTTTSSTYRDIPEASQQGEPIPSSSETPYEPDSPATWALAVCTDLTSATHIAAFQASSITTSTANISSSCPPGAVVQRVATEGKAIYIADTAQLPADVTLPFLPDGTTWKVFVVPVVERDSVVAFAAPVEAKDFSVEDRRWFQSFAARIAEGTT